MPRAGRSVPRGASVSSTPGVIRERTIPRRQRVSSDRSTRLEQERRQSARQDDGGDDAGCDTADNQAGCIGEDEPVDVSRLGLIALRTAISRRLDATDKEYAVYTDERQDAGHYRESDEQAHREGSRRDRVGANLVERLHILDRDGRIDTAQPRCTSAITVLGSATVRMTRSFEKAPACHSER